MAAGKRNAIGASQVGGEVSHMANLLTTQFAKSNVIIGGRWRQVAAGRKTDIILPMQLLAKTIKLYLMNIGGI